MSAKKKSKKKPFVKRAGSGRKRSPRAVVFDPYTSPAEMAKFFIAKLGEYQRDLAGALLRNATSVVRTARAAKRSHPSFIGEFAVDDAAFALRRASDFEAIENIKIFLNDALGEMRTRYGRDMNGFRLSAHTGVGM